jgi:hypothetical protein
MTVRVEHDRSSPGRPARVYYPTMQIRETGKHPNFMVGAMDVVANGLNTRTLLSPSDPHLLRVILNRPLREIRPGFTAAVLAEVGASALVEVGGGCGGDCALWMRCEGVRHVDVVEPDPVSVEEYQRRLLRSFHAWRSDACTLQTQSTRFVFSVASVLDLPRYAGPAAAAVLHFSVSQIVGSAPPCGTDDRPAGAPTRLFDVLADVPHLLVLAHDHTVVPLPDGRYGVSVRVDRGTGCDRHPLVCPCADRLAWLRTNVAGSRTASDIGEYAFDADWFVSVAEQHGRRTVRRVRPFPAGSHWLLESLTAIWLA